MITPILSQKRLEILTPVLIFLRILNILEVNREAIGSIQINWTFISFNAIGAHLSILESR